MKVRNFLIPCGVALSAVLAATSAQAASFTSNVSQNTDPKADIFLNSITQKGQTFSNFSYVNRAVIQYNTPRSSLNLSTSGAASTDKGDNASAPLPPNEDPTAAEIAAYLGNNNLNNIIDGEDQGDFTVDIFFDSEIVQDDSDLDHIFYWERGMNSYIDVQALDADGNPISDFLNINQTTDPRKFAGFSIDTTEIGGSQKVGAWGINLSHFGVTELSGLRLKAYGSGPLASNGPDFKFIARKTATVPEPATLLGLGAVATFAFIRRRQGKSHSFKSIC
ncbi:MAG TPA: exosortase-dependent surface protein XDP2 [Nostocaceae cyanobacterium]|nr:exosortase-dependent surface protein XDP2 [Nostocaceae cyanobacterium]